MKKILLVEDDPNIVSSLTLFMKNEGYLVDSANGQQTALQKIAQEQYDIILLDISLNDGNGFSTCSAIKSQKDIPIIFLTADDDEFSVVSGLELGADDYICKPSHQYRALFAIELPCFVKNPCYSPALYPSPRTVKRISGSCGFVSILSRNLFI